LSSDATHRYQYSEGTDCFYGDTGSLTEMIAQCEQLAKTYFNADKASVNGLSGLNTMRWVLTSLAPPSGVIYIVEPRHGGHYATETICREHGYQIEYIPYNVERCKIDCDALRII